VLGGIVDPESQIESVEHRNEAVEAARRLAVLDLMNDSSADAGDESELVLSQSQSLTPSPYRATDLFSHS
jgi:hypothetical protein